MIGMDACGRPSADSDFFAMKKLLITAIVILAAGQLFAGQVVETIVARVGDRIITRSQYLERLKGGYADLERRIPPSQLEDEKQKFEKGLLDEMLAELLIKDRADRLGLTVTKQELDEAVKNLRQQYGIKTDEQFEESLKSSGLTRAEMELRLRDTILTNKVFSRELRSRQELTDRELKERYERDKEHYRLPERAKLREIIVLTPPGSSDEQIAYSKQHAEEAAAKAKSGADFAELVKEYSGAPSRDKGGDIGVVAKGELIPALDAAVFAAAPGSIVGPIRSEHGFHVLKVEDRLPSEVPPFDAVKEKLRKEASDAAFQRDYKTYIERLRKDAFVQIHEENIPKG